MTVVRTELPDWECRTLLRSESVGRLCIIDHQMPIALPVNFRVVEEAERVRIVVRTAPETLLGRYSGLASFEVDHVEAPSGSAWSVIARGTVHQAAGAPGLPDPDPLVPDGRHTWLLLDVAALSGRRFTARPTADGYSVEWEIVGA